MEFTAESYREAALEHLQRARELHASRRYYLAHYLSGLAVECILRAYLLRITREFEARHDLRELAKAARFFEMIPVELHAEFGIAFNTLNLRWRSNHRYATEQQLWRYLSEIKADFNRKGDRRKLNSDTAYQLAYRIIALGDRKWKRR